MASSKEYRWSSQITDVTKDPIVSAWGAFCPCVLFGRNVHSITDGDVSFFKACVTHLLIGGCWGGLACYLCGPIGYWLTCLPWYSAPYRRQLRAKKGLPEIPYSDFSTHFLCHPFALCQEYREIKSTQSQPITGPGESTIDRGPEETISHVEAILKMER